MNVWQDKVPSESVLTLQQSLENISDDKIASLSAIPLKSPILGLVFGLLWGIFGVDRFYKGDIGLGIAKLCLSWLTLGVWCFIDFFLVWKGIKKDNLNKIMQSIQCLK
ncbi:NINE protein [Helicobacter saguini]|uniref:NINE protein n=2 Tax=Helicobacter saguini TaxID=1548018 RepID=A0A347W0Y4_9HELI|nr:NINE protein [Helicobacter saguini]MWV66151.1 NINE protein [Helicobacter saguini]MWV68500.1 NINE protein [Helicobacter saguini]MWV71945.1 NINE protein [Helicobacter saguini]TLD96005.1 TM2 domain-containing protein [Helicobacter saguini]